jgi:hypothetical protein
VSVPTIRTQINLDSISRLVQQLSGGSGGFQPPQIPTALSWYAMYLWTVFFKIDGDTVFVDENFKVQGTATVVGTPGDYGDLPTDPNSNSVSIPTATGYFRTKLTPIPIRPLGTTVPGVLGCVAILVAQNDTPDDAVAQGHQALNNSLQQALDALIASLTITNSTITDQEIQAIEQQVSSAVTSAITNALGLWSKILTGLHLENQASVLGTVIYRFSSSDLTSSPPAGITLQNGYPTQTVIQFGGAGFQPPPWITLTFQGKIVADPLPLSLKRILTRLGLASVRRAMASSPVPFQPPGSIEGWVDAIT